jgi:RNA polymerase-binding transcription factor
MPRRKDAVTQDRYQVLKGLLEERRREIHDKLRSLRESLPAELAEVKDAEEQSVDDFVRDVDFALMQMKSETLRRIDDAIQRLESGSYGVCASCGAEIAEARLKALPFAELCRNCQEQREETDAAGRAKELEARLAREFSSSLR